MFWFFSFPLILVDIVQILLNSICITVTSYKVCCFIISASQCMCINVLILQLISVCLLGFFDIQCVLIMISANQCVLFIISANQMCCLSFQPIRCVVYHFSQLISVCCLSFQPIWGSGCRCWPVITSLLAWPSTYRVRTELWDWSVYRN